MFLLQSVGETNRRGKPVYFGGMSAIGPMHTEDKEGAERFLSEQAARKSPAYVHLLCDFEPVDEDQPYVPF